MTRRRLLLGLVLLLLAGGALSLPAVHWRVIGWWRGEAFYQGRPTSYWSVRVWQWPDAAISGRLFSAPYPPSDWDRFREAIGLAPADVPTWPEVLGTGDGPLRIGTLDEAAVPVLLELLRDPDPLVRETVAWAFADSDNRPADGRIMPLLIEMVGTDESPVVRIWAARAAWHLDKEAATRAGVVEPPP